MPVISIVPIGAPRINYKGRFNAKAKAYYAWKDELRLGYGRRKFPNSVQLIFYMPMPKSWSLKKREAMAGRPHDQKPDIDNMIKSVLDTLMEGEDKTVFRVYAEKYWSVKPYIEIEALD